MIIHIIIEGALILLWITTFLSIDLRPMAKGAILFIISLLIIIWSYIAIKDYLSPICYNCGRRTPKPTIINEKNYCWLCTKRIKKDEEKRKIFEKFVKNQSKRPKNVDKYIDLNNLPMGIKNPTIRR